MTAKFRSNNGPPPGTADWFLPAILHDGSVDTCLAQVENELSLKHEFILALRQALRGEEESGLDAITAISNEQKLVANSLRFRLGMLQPERVGAWFRPPVATTMGPFSSAMLREPVFGPYDLKHCGKVQAKLERAYEERRVDVLPFEDDSANLWRTVLTLNARLEQACRLPKPFQKYRLDKLPDGLPESLHSVSLAAFLSNVKGEIATVRGRLDDSYEELLAASKKFWQAARMRPEKKRGFQTKDTDDMREAFRKRRQSRPKANYFAFDQQALQFMGFDGVPSDQELRKRYLDLAKKFHPDRCGGDDTQFKDLTKAYQSLSRVARK